jgi:thiol:disulfide interchange protein DsbA
MIKERPALRSARLAALVLWVFASGAAFAKGDDWYAEGIQYERISPPVATHASPGKVEVVELFWYGCSHCYRFEPYITKWLTHKPEAAEFVRFPATLNPGWVTHARVYYTLETLGELDRLHMVFFQAIHDQNRRFQDLSSIARFFAQNGVDEKRFMDAYNSLVVQTKLSQAQRLTREYGARGVPSVVVNGEYRTTATLAGGYEEVLKVVDFLVAQQSKEALGKAAPPQ